VIGGTRGAGRAGTRRMRAAWRGSTEAAGARVDRRSTERRRTLVGGRAARGRGASRRRRRGEEAAGGGARA
jgi:hypothetical protein